VLRTGSWFLADRHGQHDVTAEPAHGQGLTYLGDAASEATHPLLDDRVSLRLASPSLESAHGIGLDLWRIVGSRRGMVRFESQMLCEAVPALDESLERGVRWRAEEAVMDDGALSRLDGGRCRGVLDAVLLALLGIRGLLGRWCHVPVRVSSSTMVTIRLWTSGGTALWSSSPCGRTFTRRALSFTRPRRALPARTMVSASSDRTASRSSPY